MTFSPPAGILCTRGTQATGYMTPGRRWTMLPGDSSPPLSPHRAFVVQFRAETDVAAGQIAGRVEHVVSGQATTFQTLEGLLAFLARVLAARGAGLPETQEGGAGA